MKDFLRNVLVFSILLSSSVFAPPCAFFGTVKLDNSAVSGTLVTAHLSETGEYVATGEEISEFGKYSIVILNTDKNIKFKIAGIWSNEPEVLCLSGKTSYLDLTAISPPTSVTLPPPVCEENWTCTEWSDCLNETQTRTCIDLNDCGTNNSKPAEIQECVVPVICEENWVCSEWTTCFNELQNRACIDLNECGTLKNKPEESQECKEEPTVEQQVTEAPTGLFAGLNTFDLLTTSILGLIFLTIFLFILKRRKPKRKSKKKAKRKRKSVSHM